MTSVLPLALLAAALTLGACTQKTDVVAPATGDPFSPRGRFVGLGIYTPGQMWTQLTRGAASAHPAAATLDDDEKVIVVLDSKTGEVRQCGSLSGHCIAMNPWSAQITLAQQSPVTVLKHARQLAEEAEAERQRQGSGSRR